MEITKSGLQINPFEVNIKEKKPTSTLFHRQQHKNFSFTTTMTYEPKSEKELAGITALQSETFNYVFGITKKANKNYLVLQRTEKGSSKILAAKEISFKDKIQLRVEANQDDYTFSYALNGGNFENLGGTVSGDILSTNVAGGFTGTLLGLYATSANDAVPEQ